MLEEKKRKTAYKFRIGELLKANQIFEQSQDAQINKRLLHIELGDKKIIRVNIIANIVDKFVSDSERRFASITLDDGSGQIRARVFGEEISRFKELKQGDTILIIGLLRSFNQEIYILPEIIRKQDSKYLLVRKLEIEKSTPKALTREQKKEIKAFREEIIELIKNAEQNKGIDKEEIIMKFKNVKPGIISQEIQKLLEEGIIYEPKPGHIRYLG